MTTVVAEHPLVDAFRENGIDVFTYLPEKDGLFAVVAFTGNRSAADKAVSIVNESDVELHALRDVQYFFGGKPDQLLKEILFKDNGNQGL